MATLKKHNRVLHTVEYIAELIGGPKWRKEFKKMLEKAQRSDGTVYLKP